MNLEFILPAQISQVLERYSSVLPQPIVKKMQQILAQATLLTPKIINVFLKDEEISATTKEGMQYHYPVSI